MGRLFYTPIKRLMDGDNKYSRVIKIPQYNPSEVKPGIYELCDLTRYKNLLRTINDSDIPDEVREFLRFGATRHIVFNYAKIADYYANTTPDIQRLMEQSALVIIDVNDAIANGYVKLSKRMQELIDEQRNREKE